MTHKLETLAELKSRWQKEDTERRQLDSHYEALRQIVAAETASRSVDWPFPNWPDYKERA
jgi:hypothetical protein